MTTGPFHLFLSTMTLNMKIKSVIRKSRLPHPSSSTAAPPPPPSSSPPPPASSASLPLPSISIRPPSPPLEALLEADGERSIMAVASMTTKPSRKCSCSCLSGFPSLLPRNMSMSKSQRDAQRKPQLLRKPLPDHSNESSPTRSPLDAVLPLTSTAKLGTSPSPAHVGSVPSTPMEEISLPPSVDEAPQPPSTTRKTHPTSARKAWNTLRKSRSSTQLPALAGRLSPSVRNSPPPNARVVSVPMRGRPGSAHSGNDGFDPIKKRMSWMPGSRPASRHASQDYSQQMGPVAWVATEDGTPDYTSGLNLLKNGAKV